MGKTKEMVEPATPAATPAVAATVTVKGTLASYTSPEGQSFENPLTELIAQAAPQRMDTCGVILPHGVRAIYGDGRRTIWVCEIAHGVRPLRWIKADSPTPFGAGATYEVRQISLPYVVIFAVFDGTSLSKQNEAFFRTEPLVDEDDPLFYPALLNCSRFKPSEGRPLSWICTQKLDRSPIERQTGMANRMRCGLALLASCLLEHAFNLSSEHHEFSSWFTESRHVDKRIATIDAWEAASAKNPGFVLDVPFLPVGMSVKQVAQRIFDYQGRAPVVTTADDLARLMVHSQARARRRPK